jgi:hypothetical protein
VDEAVTQLLEAALEHFPNVCLLKADWGETQSAEKRYEAQTI